MHSVTVGVAVTPRLTHSSDSVGLCLGWDRDMGNRGDGKANPICLLRASGREPQPAGPSCKFERMVQILAAHQIKNQGVGPAR